MRMQDNPFADMGKLMENVKKAQELVKVEGARVQEELAKCAHVWLAVLCTSLLDSLQTLCCITALWR